MKIKNIIIYYPSFERGGVEKILVNLIDYLVKKKIFISLITIKNKNNFFLKENKYLKIITPKKKIFNLFPERYISALSCIIPLLKMIKKFNRKNTIIHSMQSNIVAILIAKSDLPEAVGPEIKIILDWLSIVSLN